MELRCRSMRWAGLLAAPLLLAGTCGIGEPDVEERTLSADLSGAEAVPPVETAGGGKATARLFGSRLEVRGTFFGLSTDLIPLEEEPIRLAEAPPGETGNTGLALHVESVDRRSGTFEILLALDEPSLESFRQGLLYVVVRSTGHPEGELRAQLR
jgi:hypothetical protein